MQRPMSAKPAPGPSGHYRFGDAEIDVGAHTLCLRGTPCDIEPKTFDVLMQLVTHSGDVVTKNQLLDRVWGHRCVTPNVLSRVIAQLRHALADSAHAPHYIETVPTLGYRFIAQLQTWQYPRNDSVELSEKNAGQDSNLMEEIQRMLSALEGREPEFPALLRHLDMLNSLFGDRPSGMVLYELAMHYGLEMLAEQEIDLPWRNSDKFSSEPSIHNP